MEFPEVQASRPKQDSSSTVSAGQPLHVQYTSTCTHAHTPLQAPPTHILINTALHTMHMHARTCTPTFLPYFQPTVLKECPQTPRRSLSPLPTPNFRRIQCPRGPRFQPSLCNHITVSSHVNHFPLSLGLCSSICKVRGLCQMISLIDTSLFTLSILL